MERKQAGPSFKRIHQLDDKMNDCTEDGTLNTVGLNSKFRTFFNMIDQFLQVSEIPHSEHVIV